MCTNLLDAPGGWRRGRCCSICRRKKKSLSWKKQTDSHARFPQWLTRREHVCGKLFAQILSSTPPKTTTSLYVHGSGTQSTGGRLKAISSFQKRLLFSLLILRWLNPDCNYVLCLDDTNMVITLISVVASLRTFKATRILITSRCSFKFCILYLREATSRRNDIAARPEIMCVSTTHAAWLTSAKKCKRPTGKWGNR